VPAPTDGATIVLRRRHFALAGSMLGIVALGVAVLAYVALRRSASAPTTPDATTPSAAFLAAASTPPGAPQDQPRDQTLPPGAASSTTTEPPAISPTAPAPPTRPPPAATHATLPTTTGTTGGYSGPPQLASSNMAGPTNRGREVTGLTRADAPVVPAAFSPGVRSAGTAKAFLPLAFDAKALVSEGSRQRERDTTVHFADGKVIVVAEDKPNDVLHAVPYDLIASISYSTGRDPLWNSPQGPAAVARAGGGGAMGIFHGARHWVTLRTRDAADLFVVLRFSSDVQVGRAIKALEERTSHTVEVVVERKDAR
jgi:hypothetical protein